MTLSLQSAALWGGGTAAAAAIALLPSPAAASTLAAARYDAGLGAIVLPYQGTSPRFTEDTLKDPPRVVLEFDAEVAFEEQPSELVARHPTLVRWAMARIREDRVRLTLIFSRTTDVQVYDDPVSRRLVVFPEPALAVVPSPAPTPTTRPTPAPTPPALADLRPVEAATRPLPVNVTFTAPYYTYEENFPTGDVLTRGAGILGPGVRLEAWGQPGLFPAFGGGPLTSDWHADLRASTLAYSFQDRNLPVSIHSRNELRGEALLGRRLDFGWLELDAGLGYLLRWETAIHSGAPPTPTYAFSSARLLHGPLLGGRLVLKLDAPLRPLLFGSRGWRIVLDGAASPYMFTQIDENISTQLPSLAAYRGEAAFEKTFAFLRLGVGYRRWGTVGSGYHEAFEGPVVSVGLVGED